MEKMQTFNGGWVMDEAAAAAAAAAKQCDSPLPKDADLFGKGAPPKFLKGIGLSVWQNSGDKHSNWAHFMENKDYFGQPELKNAANQSNNFWNRYEEDIKLVASLGATAFRFSFEWARIQPLGPDDVDQDALKRFHEIVNCVERNNLVPMVTLHHFTHPQWFETLGGFAVEENIKYFLKYTKIMFEEFSKQITLWTTFNEANCFAFVGYIMGLWAPGERMGFTKAGEVLSNMLKAHCQTYKQIKAMPRGDVAQIGYVHQHIKFYSGSTGVCKLWLKPVCRWMTYWFAAEVVLKFFMTGEFKWKAPFWGTRMKFQIKEAPSCLDFWGINYYSRPCISWRGQMVPGKAHEHLTDNGFRVYPKGLYESISDAAPLGKPIYITENGLADKNSKYRAEFVQGHFSEILHAIRDGFDVRGVFWWTLVDNIEWHEGFHYKFGLFEWDPTDLDRSKGFKKRPGTDELERIYKCWPELMLDVKLLADGRRASGGGGSTIHSLQDVNIETMDGPPDESTKLTLI